MVAQHLVSAPGKSLKMEEETHSPSAGEVVVSAPLFSVFGPGAADGAALCSPPLPPAQAFYLRMPSTSSYPLDELQPIR